MLDRATPGAPRSGAFGTVAPPLGGKYEHDVRLPSGQRPDAVDFESSLVRELKPDNPRAIRLGMKQLARYLRELQRLTGKKWTSFLDSYE